jgi:hypothetical protein
MLSAKAMNAPWIALGLLLAAPAAMAGPSDTGLLAQAPGAWGQQNSGNLSFPAQGVICDSSSSVCFNATGAAIADTEREFGRRARLALENYLVNSPILEVTFADGRYCNFSQRGCWTTNQRTQFDPRLNPWLFGGAAGTQPGQGTVIGGNGTTWGPGAGTVTPGVPAATNPRWPFTRTEQRGRCKWTNVGTTIYEGNCRYAIVQNNGNASRTLDFTMDELPLANPMRTMRFTATGGGPWSLSLPNGTALPARAAVDAGSSRTRVSLDWATFTLNFTSYTAATSTPLNQALQPIGTYGQPTGGSGFGQAMGGLLQQLFGGN